MSGTTTPLAIVLTLNEAEHLPGCLASLAALTDDVLVLDSGSSDETAQLARAAGALVVTRPFTGYASQRNAALDLAEAAGWVLFLDADERLTPAGAEEIRAAIARAGSEVAAFWLPRRNLAFGRALRGGGWWPDHQARLLRPERLRYDERHEVHEIVLIDGESRKLTQPLIHLNYTTRREFVRKQRVYTSLRANHHGWRPRRRAYLAGPAREFWRRFVRLRGYRDGVDGLFMAAVLAGEELRACRLARATTKA